MYQDIEIRQAGGQDAEAIRSLVHEAYAKWIPLLGREPIPMTVDYHDALTKHRFDMMYFTGDLVGLIETAGERDYLLIVNVAVAPAHQGKGMGRALMQHAERLAAGTGFGEVKLYTNKLFAADVSFYLRLGYRIEREEDLSFCTLVHMHKVIR